MPLAQVVNVYFDTTQYGNPSKLLLKGLTDPAVISSVGMVSQDTFTLNLWPRVTSQQQGVPTTTQQLANPGQLGFTGKKVGALSSASLLFNCSGFVELQDGNGNWYYQAILTLNTDEMIAAVNGQTYLNVQGEIENLGVLMGGVTQEQRLQIPITVYPAVYTGSEGVPTSATPGYYNTAQADARFLPIAPINGNYEVVTNGSGSLFKVWNPVQGIYQTISISGAPGLEQLVIGQS